MRFLLFFVLLKYSVSANPTAEHARRCYSNKRIVFIGDFLTRVQYLNLANALLSGDWRMRPPSMTEYDGWGGWKGFLLGTNLRLGCNEICDCYRVNPYKENRYYFDYVQNISITFFLWLPTRYPMYGNFPPTTEDFDRRCSNWTEVQKAFDNFKRTSQYNYSTIFSFVDNIVRPMRADAIVINQGLWPYDALRTPDGVSSLSTSIRAATKRYIWKTTTASNVCGIEPMDNATFKHLLRSGGFEIFDAFALTRPYVGQNESYSYIDQHHFKNNVYAALNLALVKHLCPEIS